MQKNEDLIYNYDLIFNEKTDMLEIYEATMRLSSFLDVELEKTHDEKEKVMARISTLSYDLDLIKYDFQNIDFDQSQMNPGESCKDLVRQKLNSLKEIRFEVEELKKRNKFLEGELKEINQMLSGDCNDVVTTNNIQITENVNFGKLIKE